MKRLTLVFALVLVLEAVAGPTGTPPPKVDTPAPVVPPNQPAQPPVCLEFFTWHQEPVRVCGPPAPPHSYIQPPASQRSSIDCQDYPPGHYHQYPVINPYHSGPREAERWGPKHYPKGYKPTYFDKFLETYKYPKVQYKSADDKGDDKPDSKQEHDDGVLKLVTRLITEIEKQENQLNELKSMLNAEGGKRSDASAAYEK